MKKASLPAIAATAVLCFIFWLLLTGQLASLIAGEPSLEVLIAGCLVSIGVAAFSARFFIHEKPFFFFNPVRIFWLLVYCICIFPVELFKANWDVARRALSPGLPIDPGIVKIPVDLKSQYGQAMLADSITLTPGTIIMNTVEEDGKNYYYVHWINVASEDHEEAGQAIKGRLEKWAERIWD